MSPPTAVAVIAGGSTGCGIAGDLVMRGVDVDVQLRPRNGTGAVEFGNFRAAGAVLGGADLAAGKSASGVSLATGWRAGALAAEGAA